MRISLYLLVDGVGFDAVDIKPSIQTFKISEPFEAQLFVDTPDPTPPSWQTFLLDAFDQLDLAETVTHRVVLVFSVDGKKFFAITFGHGYQLLQANSFVRDFGLKTALGLVLNGGSAERLRSIDLQTISESPLRSRAQLLANAEIERFGFDVRKDLLKAVTGVPGDSKWGTRVSGKHALFLSRKGNFADLPIICAEVMMEYSQQTYKTEFPWIDNITHIEDRSNGNKLLNALIQALEESEELRRSFIIGPPEIIDWEVVEKLKLNVGNLDDIETLTYADYYESLRADSRDKLSSKVLDSHRLQSLDADGKPRKSWSLRHCLEGEFTYDGEQYILADGDFYRIAKSYMEELDDFIESVPIQHQLPHSRFRQDKPDKDLEEADYNEGVTRFTGNVLWKEEPLWTRYDDYLLLDRKTVKINQRTTAIEVADILSKSKQLIHVKRHFSSSGLSHLFSQATVSSELLVASTDFRKVVEAKVKKERKAQEKNANTFHEDFTKGFVPRDWTITLAVVGPWEDRKLAHALPFFSKVNLRNCVQHLCSLGYNVEFERIEIVPDIANLEEPHEVLGLGPEPSKADVKRKAKWLAKLFHPDKTDGSNALMSKINVARDKLLDVDLKT